MWTQTWLVCFHYQLVCFFVFATFPFRACTAFCSLQIIFGISFSGFVVQSRVKGEQWPHDGAVGTFEIPRAFRGAEICSVILFLLILKKKFNLKGYREKKTTLTPANTHVCVFVILPQWQRAGTQGSVLSFSSVSLLYLSGCPEPSICWNAVACGSSSSLLLEPCEFCL